MSVFDQWNIIYQYAYSLSKHRIKQSSDLLFKMRSNTIQSSVLLFPRCNIECQEIVPFSTEYLQSRNIHYIHQLWHQHGSRTNNTLWNILLHLDLKMTLNLRSYSCLILTSISQRDSVQHLNSQKIRRNFEVLEKRPQQYIFYFNAFTCTIWKGVYSLSDQGGLSFTY